MESKNDAGLESSGWYADNDMPGLFKLFFVLVVIWGVIFSAWYILGREDTQKNFDLRQKGVGLVTQAADRPA